MDDFNNRIDRIINWLTEPNGGNAVTESDIRGAISELNELRKLYLSDMSDSICLAKFFKNISEQEDCPIEIMNIINKEYWNLI